MLPFARSSLLGLAGVALLAAPLPAQTYLGPSPCLSRTDSPLILSKPALEDLEDGTFDLFGATADNGTVSGPAANCDSVDGDDGVLDGSGSDGRSLFHLQGNVGMTFTFDDALLGGFPTSAGLVWTDGGIGATVSFEAFDAGGASLGVVGPFSIADGSNNGTTGEDHFFGIASRHGISAIKVSNAFGGLEVDHVQYSLGALSLEANDTSLTANEPLTLTLAGGAASQVGVLVALAVDGKPDWLPVLVTTFDAAGEIVLAATVPSGLAGLDVDFAGFGFAASGKVRFSNEVALAFQ